MLVFDKGHQLDSGRVRHKRHVVESRVARIETQAAYLVVKEELIP